MKKSIALSLFVFITLAGATALAHEGEDHTKLPNAASHADQHVPANQGMHKGQTAHHDQGKHKGLVKQHNRPAQAQDHTAKK